MAVGAAGLALFEAGTGLAQTLFSRRRRKRFSETAEGQLLTEVAEEGALNQAAQQRALGQVGAVTGQQAQIQKAQIRGRLAAANVTDSVAGERALAQPGIQQQQQVAEAQSELQQFNVQTQREARLQLARGEGRVEELREAESAQFRSELASGLVGAVGGFLEGRAIDQESSRQFAALASAQEKADLNVLISSLEAGGLSADQESQIRQRIADILGLVANKQQLPQ